MTEAAADTAFGAWQDGEVRIIVPAELGHVRLVRLSAAAFADRLGFNVDEIEDVRVAVDELASCLIERASSGALTVVLSASAQVFAVAGHVAATQNPVVDELTAQILGAVVNSYETGTANGTAWFRAEKSIPDK